MKVISLKLLRFFRLLIVCFLLIINVQFYKTTNNIEFGNEKYDEELYFQLLNLKHKMHNDLADKLQVEFPEGLVFSYALYGLSWADFIEPLDHSSDLWKEGMQEISFAIKELHSDDAKVSFTADLPLRYGAFYRGWSNYVLGRKLQILPPKERLLDEIKIFTLTCKEIANAMEVSECPFLSSYQGSSWPTDGIVAAANLALNDAIFGEHYKPLLSEWIIKVRLIIDDNSGLLPHLINPVNCSVEQGPRGSSQSLQLIFLPSIDSVFANEQYAMYRSIFVIDKLGLPGIKEFSSKGISDIDSGPVILEIGAAASIVGQKTLAVFKDYTTSKGLAGSIEFFGCTTTFYHKKQFLFGELPIADLWIAWARSTLGQNKAWEDTMFVPWSIHFISFFIILILYFGDIRKFHLYHKVGLNRAFQR